MAALDAPFPWFGGKSKVAPIVWRAFGSVQNYVEPFFGSGAVLLARPPGFVGAETVNDRDGFVANFWRAVQADPDAVAEYADWPVNENDLHARHSWLIAQRSSLVSRLEGDVDFFDARIAGYWVWGVSCWIGGDFCGIPRKLVHLGDPGKGVNRRRPHLGNAGEGTHRKTVALTPWMRLLSERLRRVRVCCGDWSRIVGNASTTHHNGITGVFLDPPYSEKSGRTMGLYAEDSSVAAHEAAAWAIENGDNPDLRIVLCGYEGEHELPSSWRVLAWKSQGGYSRPGSNGYDNSNRERLWMSPHCNPLDILRNVSLFDHIEEVALDDSEPLHDSEMPE